MNIITRAQWGARQPRSIQTVSMARRTGFMVHHSGAPASQSVRVIQDFHMDTRGWSDIGYNFLVRDTGATYEGRGWNRVGAHASGANITDIGVCCIGNYDTTDPPGPMLESLRQLYAEAVSLTGQSLRKRSHRDVNHTDCPGDRLYAAVPGLYIPGPGVTPDPVHPGGRELYLTDPVMQGTDVRWVQRWIGPPCGPADGLYGPHTAAGVRWYQAIRGIGVDGRVGRKTWAQMGIHARF